jgi:hypothetical protein
LNNIGDCFHLYALRLVDILEGIEITGLLVLDDPNLRNGSVW